MDARFRDRVAGDEAGRLRHVPRMYKLLVTIVSCDADLNAPLFGGLEYLDLRHPREQ